MNIVPLLFLLIALFCDNPNSSADRPKKARCGDIYCVQLRFIAKLPYLMHCVDTSLFFVPIQSINFLPSDNPDHYPKVIPKNGAWTQVHQNRLIDSLPCFMDVFDYNAISALMKFHTDAADQKLEELYSLYSKSEGTSLGPWSLMAFVISKSDSWSLPFIRRRLNDPHPMIRGEIAFTLMFLRDTTSLPLVRALAIDTNRYKVDFNDSRLNKIKHPRVCDRAKEALTAFENPIRCDTLKLWDGTKIQLKMSKSNNNLVPNPGPF